MNCPNCNEEILGDLKWDNWIKIMNFIHCLELEEAINSRTAEAMSNAMMSFKKYAMDEEPIKKIKK